MCLSEAASRKKKAKRTKATGGDRIAGISERSSKRRQHEEGSNYQEEAHHQNEEQRLQFFWNLTQYKADQIVLQADFVHKDELSQTVFGKDELIFNIFENEFIRSASSFRKPDPFEDKSFDL